jgi:hypothetical protein
MAIITTETIIIIVLNVKQWRIKAWEARKLKFLQMFRSPRNKSFTMAEAKRHKTLPVDRRANELWYLHCPQQSEMRKKENTY